MPRVAALPATALAPEIAQVYERFTSAGNALRIDHAGSAALAEPSFPSLQQELRQ